MGRVAILGATVLCLLGVATARAASWGRVDLSTEYRAQWTDEQGGGTADDHDFSTLLAVDVDRTGIERLTFSGLAWYAKDLDGTGAGDPFRDTLDTFDDRDDFRIYRAELHYELPEGNVELTGGRFEVWSAEVATLDGGLVSWAPCPWFEAEGFGGRIVSHYRDPEKDGIYGANLSLRPLPGALLRLEDLYYIENSLELSYRQDIGRWGSGQAAYRMIDDDPQRIVLGADFYPWQDGEVHLRYNRKLAYDDPDFIYDYTSAGDDTVDHLDFTHLDPYADYVLEARQGFLEHFGLGGRIRYHKVIDEKDEDDWNVNFIAGALIFDASGWPWSGFRLDAEVTGWSEDRDRDDLNEDELWGYYLRFRQQVRKHSFGAGVYRQEYDTAGRPRDSFGFDLWSRLHLCERADLYLRYEREDDDLYDDEGFDALNAFTARLDLSF